MSVKLELYRVFQAAAESGSISAAAQQLYISQPAASQAIRQLEQQCGAALFARSRRGVCLTEEGQLLYQYVCRGLDLIRSGEEKLEQARQLQRGRLTIGASDTVTRSYLLPRLEAFHKSYPAVQLQILNGTSQTLLGYLQSGQVDLAYVSDTQNTAAFPSRHCFDTHTIFVAAPDYPCDFSHPYTLQEIAALPLILLERKASSRLFLEQFFQSRGVALKPEIELCAHELLLSLAQIGLGVAGVTEEYAQSALAEGSVRPLTLAQAIPHRSVLLCTPPNTSPSAAAARFMEHTVQPLNII